jgi:hypothetical protein
MVQDSNWRALDVAAASDPRLEGLNYQQLAARAEKQHAQVEKRRLQVAHAVFGIKASGNSSHTRKSRSYDARVERPRMSRKTITGGVLLGVAAVVAVDLAPDLVKVYENLRDVRWRL